MLRVAFLNGCKHNYDHDLTKMIGALITGSCVVEGLVATAGQVSAWYGFLKATRDNGDIAHILVHLTADDTTVDTSGTKKIWIELAQTHIDDSSLINEDQNNVATIQTGASYPAYEHIKIAWVVSSVITDERVMITLSGGVNNTGNETINGVKTFGSFPLLPNTSPTTDYQAVHKKYVDDLVNLANAINRFEGLRYMGEDLAQHDTYFIGRKWGTVDATGGTINDLICGSSGWDLTQFIWLTSHASSAVLRRIRSFEVNEEGAPSADLTVYGVLSDDTEVQIATTSDASLTTGSAITLDADAKYVKLKFLASGSDATNYYKIKINTGTIEEASQQETTVDLEDCDSSAWTEFASVTLQCITSITGIDFDFKTTDSAYFAEMDWRVKKNGTVFDWPNDASGTPSTDREAQSATWLSEACVAGDVITLEMMTPTNRSTGDDYVARNFTVTGTGQTIKGNQDFWYEAGKKYLARMDNEHRATFDGLELTGGSEWAQTEGAEWGTTAITTELYGRVYLDQTGWLTNTYSKQYVGEGKGFEIEIRRDNDMDFDELTRRWEVELVSGEVELTTMETTQTSSDQESYDLTDIKYEVNIKARGTYGFRADLASGDSSSNVYWYFGIYVNDVFIAEASQQAISFSTKTHKIFVEKWDNVKFYLRTSHASEPAQIKNLVVVTGGYVPIVELVS